MNDMGQMDTADILKWTGRASIYNISNGGYGRHAAVSEKLLKVEMGWTMHYYIYLFSLYEIQVETY